jgi:hypothetical protein
LQWGETMPTYEETNTDQLAVNDSVEQEVVTSYALLTVEMYETLTGTTVTETDRVAMLIRVASLVFEFYCNRPLKARDFHYDSAEDAYDEHRAIFDGPPGVFFFFPTYPVNSITTLIISDTTITAATAYDDSDGYHLYNKAGKIRYDGGFDHGYPRNVKAAWNGGYADNDVELFELQQLCALMVQSMLATSGEKFDLQSERLGNYSYSLISPKLVVELQGMNPKVFSRLSRYRKAIV